MNVFDWDNLITSSIITHVYMRLLIVALILLSLFFLTSEVEARSGCCSHHGGVSGCQCGDGTPLSATCLPYYPECNGGGNSMPTSQAVVSYPTSVIYPTNTPIALPTKIITIKPTALPKTQSTTGAPSPTFKDEQQSKTNDGSAMGAIAAIPLGIFGLMYGVTKLKSKIK